MARSKLLAINCKYKSRSKLLVCEQSLRSWFTRLTDWLRGERGVNTYICTYIRARARARTRGASPNPLISGCNSGGCVSSVWPVGARGAFRIEDPGGSPLAFRAPSFLLAQSFPLFMSKHSPVVFPFFSPKGLFYVVKVRGILDFRLLFCLLIRRGELYFVSDVRSPIIYQTKPNFFFFFKPNQTHETLYLSFPLFALFEPICSHILINVYHCV